MILKGLIHFQVNKLRALICYRLYQFKQLY
nr:MAG TPA: hypothetical protein [Bacteriophage sp.]